MRHLSLLLLLLSAATPLSAAPADDAGTPAADKRNRVQLSSDQCGLSTPFNVLIDSGGVWLYRDSGIPKEIFFHGGELSVDKQVRQVSAADAQRLWQIEAQAQQLMPQVTSIAHDAAGMTFDALDQAYQAVTGSDGPSRKLKAYRKDTARYIDKTLGIGRWDQELFDETFEAKVEAAATSFSGSLVRSALWQAMTGRADAMDERMDAMDDTLDARIEAQTTALEAKAATLCPQVRSLYALQDALEYRYNGQPLRMIELEADEAETSSPQVAAAPTPEDHGDHRDTRIKVEGSESN